MDKKSLILVGISLILIATAAFAGFNLGQEQSIQELTGLTFVSENGTKFCVTVENNGVLVSSRGICVN